MTSDWPIRKIAGRLGVVFGGLLVIACTHAITVPPDAWNQLYQLDLYREQALTAVKVLDEAKTTLGDQQFRGVKLSYAEARAAWNAWLDALETLVLNNGKVEDWPDRGAKAETAASAAMAFYSDHGAAQQAFQKIDAARAASEGGGAGSSTGGLAGAAGAATGTTGTPFDILSLAPRAFDELLKYLNQVQQGKVDQRNILIVELEKRKWPLWECVVTPTATGCSRQAPPMIPGGTMATPTSRPTP